MPEKPYFADAHCHLDLFPDPTGTVRDSVAMGVRTIIATGGDKRGAIAIPRLADGVNVFGVIGIDPTFAAQEGEFVEELAALFTANKHLVGIGEIGLDMTKTGGSPMNIQRKVFERQLDLALELDKPVVIHARQALHDVMVMVTEKGIKRLMFHFFEGDETDAKAAEKYGYLVSISPGESSKKRRVIKALDLNSIVAETDSPVVGRTPADAIPVVETIAAIKGIDVAEAADRTTSNVKKFFYI